jgi:hypothetical protein
MYKIVASSTELLSTETPLIDYEWIKVKCILKRAPDESVRCTMSQDDIGAGSYQLPCGDYYTKEGLDQLLAYLEQKFNTDAKTTLCCIACTKPLQTNAAPPIRVIVPMEDISFTDQDYNQFESYQRVSESLLKKITNIRWGPSIVQRSSINYSTSQIFLAAQPNTESAYNWFRDFAINHVKQYFISDLKPDVVSAFSTPEIGELAFEHLSTHYFEVAEDILPTYFDQTIKEKFVTGLLEAADSNKAKENKLYEVSATLP